MYVIGLSSGTSVDGVDAALVLIAGRPPRPRIRLVSYRTFPYPPRLRERVLACQTDAKASLAEVCRLNAYLGEVFADAALGLARRARMPIGRIGLIGSHGQTIAHEPRRVREGKYLVAGTLQIGEPAVIAERTGVTTVANFRARDLAAGGQGAPLTPLIHHVHFAHPSRHRLIVNLGGIANVTWIPAGNVLDRSQVLAFDTGPANMVIDGVVARITKGRETLDRAGKLAASGTVDERLLRRLMRHPFLASRPPKSTGRETFGAPLVARILQVARRDRVADRDVVATVTAFTAQSIVDAYERYLRPLGRVHDVIVGGGGVRNVTLMRALRAAFDGARVASLAAYGVDPKAIEATAFALLAYLARHRQPGNIPSATGAGREAVLGTIIPAEHI